MSDRHTTYFELRDALDGSGCVVCRLAARSVRRYLEALSFESVNDYALRAQLRRGRGFCNLHAWQLLDDVRDPFGAGIIYRDVLNACVGLVERSEVARLDPEESCLACEYRDRAAARYVDALTDHLGERELARRYESSGGLCWRHFGTAVARTGRGLRMLAEVQRAALVGVVAGEPTAVEGRGRPAPVPGIRAGTAAPRTTADEERGDPLVGAAVGRRGVQGPAIGRLEAVDRHVEAPEAEVAAGGDDCAVCALARATVERVCAGPELLGGESPELCPPHGWLMVDRAGAAAVRERLAPTLRLLVERIAASGPALQAARFWSLGRLELAAPGARRARGDLAVALGPPRGCAVCQVQLAAERRAFERGAGGVLCRPHLRASALHGVGANVLPTWRALVAELDEYIRKNDYRFRDEPRGKEQTSPWRAVAVVAGAPGVR